MWKSGKQISQKPSFWIAKDGLLQSFKTPICEGMQLSNEGFASLFVVSSFTGHMEDLISCHTFDSCFLLSFFDI